MTKALEYHEIAQIFPMDEENIDALAEDIRAYGLRMLIETYKGKILDGRRRYQACKMAGIEPITKEVNPEDPIAYVLSLNLHRRHLNPSQLSMVAARAREMYDRQAKERMKKGGGDKKSGVENLPPPIDNQSKARDAAGKAVGVSGKSVDYATRVLEHGTPELIKAVDEGRMAVSTAAIHAMDPPEDQRRIVTEPKRNRKYTTGVGGGNMGIKSSEEPSDPQPGESRGMGVRRAYEAIDCLKKIPKNDPLRNRAFQIVMDYIKHNK